MTMFTRLGVYFLLASAGFTPSATAQIIGATEAVKLLANDGNSGDYYGKSVALDGTTLAIGAWMDDHLGDQAGSVYVYVLNGPNWVLQQKLTVTTVSSQYRFGESLSLQGDRLAVGCAWDGVGAYQSGAVYVFERSGTVWTQTAKLKGSNVFYNRNLGRSVALDGDTIAAGAPIECCFSNPPGNVYVFRLVGGVWIEEAVLSGQGALASAALGHSVALAGDLLVAGEPHFRYTTNAQTPGFAHVYLRTGSVWTETQRLSNPSGYMNGLFGQSVAFEGNTIVIGAPEGPVHGQAYVFEDVGGTWTLTQQLLPNDERVAGEFGESVAIEGAQIAVGAPLAVGGVYVFERSAGTWTQRSKLIQSEAGLSDRLAGAVTLDGGRLLAGAQSDDDLGTESGAAFLYALPAVSVGTPFCAGDGSAGPCPCGNESTPGHQLGCRNYFGQGAWLFAVGSASASVDDLELHAFGGLTRRSFLVASTVSGAAATYGNGLSCLSSPFLVRSAAPIGGQSYARFGPGLGATAGWGPGQTWYFQQFYRDAGTCNGGKNASNAVAVTIAP